MESAWRLRDCEGQQSKSRARRICVCQAKVSILAFGVDHLPASDLLDYESRPRVGKQYQDCYKLSTDLKVSRSRAASDDVDSESESCAIVIIFEGRKHDRMSMTICSSAMIHALSTEG